MTNTRVLKAALLTLAAAALLPAAFADTFTLQFSTLSGTAFSGSGVGTAVVDPYNHGAYDIAGGTVTVAGDPSTYRFVVSTPTDSHDSAMVDGFTYSNVIYGPAVFPSMTGSYPEIGPYGILISNGTTEFELFLADTPGITHYALEFSPKGSSQAISFSAHLTPAATPEPSGLALLATGALGVASFARRRFMRA